MAERWVINASPIILLAKAEVIQFLPALCQQLVVPSGVAREVQRGLQADLGRTWLAGAGRPFIRPVPDLDPTLKNWRGGDGEAEVISWALQNPGFSVVLDDRQARAFARANGLTVLGSLRIIVLAKEKGFIAAAKPALERLRGAGAYVSNDLINQAIALAGES